MSKEKGMIKYNKLIRDKVPEIMDSRGVKYKIRPAEVPGEYWKKLKDKLVEEAKEFRDSSDPKELADVLEVIEAICSFKNIDKKLIKKLKREIAKERGKFEKGIILIKAKK